MMSSPNVKIILNPEAKGGRSKKIARKVEKSLKDHGIDYQFAETEAPYHAYELAKRAKEENINMVIALGGDGTVHEVANGAIASGLSLGVIPAGSGNDFAEGIGIKKWEDGIETLINGKKMPISILKSGDRYVVNILDAGFGGDVAKASQKHLRWISGAKKYKLLTVALLLKHKPYKVTIDIDGEVTDWNLNLFVAGFGQTFGSGMHILPDARYNQDKMKISLIHDTGKFKFLRIFPKVYSAKHVEYVDNVKMLEAKKVIITPSEENDKPLRAEADGELFSDGPLTIEVIQNGLNVLVPSDWNYEQQSLKIK